MINKISRENLTFEGPCAKAFVRIKPQFNRMRREEEQKKFRIVPYSNRIIVKTLKNCDREFMFNGIFDQSSSIEAMFKSSVLPLIRTTVVDHKDCSLLFYGSKHSGKIFKF